MSLPFIKKRNERNANISMQEFKSLHQNIGGVQDEILLNFIYMSYEILGKRFEEFFKKNYQLSPSQSHTLCYLKLHGKMTMSDLASVTNSSRQHMTKLVDSLIEDGLATRSFDPKDRRVVCVEPTEKGIEEIDSGERRFIRQILNNIEKLSPEKQLQTIEAIKMVNEFMADMKTYDDEDSEM